MGGDDGRVAVRVMDWITRYSEAGEVTRLSCEWVPLSWPLPTDRAERRRVLDAACLSLWGGREWTRPRRKKAARMPPSWKAAVLGSMLDRRERAA